MAEYELSNDSRETASIQTQLIGEELDYKSLSPVSKRRVAAALQMYLDYIFAAMAEVEPEVINCASDTPERNCKEV